MGFSIAVMCGGIISDKVKVWSNEITGCMWRGSVVCTNKKLLQAQPLLWVTTSFITSSFNEKINTELAKLRTIQRLLATWICLGRT